MLLLLLHYYHYVVVYLAGGGRCSETGREGEADDEFVCIEGEAEDEFVCIGLFSNINITIEFINIFILF